MPTTSCSTGCMSTAIPCPPTATARSATCANIPPRSGTSCAWPIRVRRERGIDVLQGCNPPDLIFIVAWALRPFGVRYLFDHHDVCPELYETKFGRKGAFWGLMRTFEWLTFRTASVSIATNDSFAAIARDRGGMATEDVFVVRSAPRTETFRIGPPDPALRQGFAHLVGWVGVIGQQEGLDLLVAAADHLIRDLGRDDVHFAIIGFGPHLPVIEAEVARPRARAAFHLHRAAIRR